MMDATMYIVSPGKPSHEIMVPVSKWDAFTEFMKGHGEELVLPRGVRKVFIVSDGESPDKIEDEWYAWLNQ